jgi:hypothetical protein
MRLFRHFCSWLGCLALVLTAGAVRADAPPDPLRLVSEQADFFVKVEQPRRLVEAVTGLDIVRRLQAIEAVRELSDSTNLRRLRQLLAYVEKELGVERMELLDRLAGGGAVLAVQFGAKPAPALFILEGKDEALTGKFFKLALAVLEEELARQEAKDRPEKGSYRDVETVRIGKEFHAAALGTALLLSNSEKALQAAIDQRRQEGSKSLAGSASVAEARRLLPPEPLAWAWLNLETVRKAPQAKDVFALPRNEPTLTVLFGGWLDVAGRSPFLCAGLSRERTGFRATVRMPRGREGMPTELAAHLPPADGPGSLPLLEPRGVLYSSSFYLDVSKFWEHRAGLLNERQLKGLEDFNKNSAVFLAGTQLSRLLTQAGAHHRIVVAHQAQTGYKIMPAQRIPAFAVLMEMREPEAFGRSLEAILRAAALLGGTQVKLKLVEEKHGDRTIVGYRFPEDAEVKGDTNKVRFNFSPCFVRVGNQFIVSSTLGLGRELVELVEAEAKGEPAQASPASVRTRLYASGGVELLRDNEDQLLAETILSQALPPEAAQEQVRAFLELVRRLGTVQLEAHYGPNTFRYDVRWMPAGARETQ